MKKHGFLSKLLCVILTLSLLMCDRGVSVLADTTENDRELSTQYLSEVKMFYAESMDKARAECEKEGYTFCPQNLTEKSETKIQTYLGYKSTTDPDDAITDLTLLDYKNSNFEEMTYKEFLDKHVKDFADQANQVMVLVNELRRQYKAGSPYAKTAYESLNHFVVDESKAYSGDNLFGHYILNKADAGFFEKFMQRGNAQILGTIVNILCFAASDYNEEGTTWIDRAKTSSIETLYQKADSAEKAQYDTWYKGLAVQFVKMLTAFRETYIEAATLRARYGDTFGYDTTEGLTADSGVEALYNVSDDCMIPEYAAAMQTYVFLDSIVFQEASETVVTDAAYLYEEEDDSEAEATVVYTERKTLAQVFMELSQDSDVLLHPEKVYPFVEAMTAAQRKVMSLGGLTNLVKGLLDTHLSEEAIKKSAAEAEEKLTALGYRNGKIGVWSGIDTSIYSLKTAETGDAVEIEKSGAKVTDSTNAAARKAASDRTIALEIADIATLAVGGTILLIEAGAGVTLWTAGSACFMMANIGMTAGFTGLAIGWGIAGTLLCCLHVLNIILVVVALVYMIYMIMDWAGAFPEYDDVDYSIMPNILFHVKQNSTGSYRVRYDAVTSNANKKNMLLMWLWDNDYDDTRWYRGVLDGSYTDDDVDDLFDHMAYYDRFDYKGVRGDVSDICAWQGCHDRWTAVYTSKSPAAGKPIEVTPGETFFTIQYNDIKTPEGYRPVTLVSGVNVFDFGSFKVGTKDKTGTAAYLYLKTGTSGGQTDPGKTDPGTEDPGTDTPGTEDPGTENPGKEDPGTDDPGTDDPGQSDPGKTDSGEVVPASQYITRVRIAHASTREEAQNILKKDGFLEFFDLNLTPYDGYTCLGYQKGSETNAITDIRACATPTDSITFGDASYSRAGLPESGYTPDGMTLFYTVAGTAGTPITRISIEKERLPLGSGAEPVCLFSGGNAVDFKHKWSDNQRFELNEVTWEFFDYEEIKTAQDDSNDGYYIYFWPKVQYKASGENEQAPYVAGFSYFLAVRSGDSGDQGTNAQFMKNFAKNNGFELVMENGSAARMMSQEAGRMNFIGSWQDCEGGALGHDWRYDLYHYQFKGSCNNRSDGAMGDSHVIGRILDEETVDTEMYFGVSYTWNPYRAITGLSGLITSYTETSHSIRYTGISTAAGEMQASNVSIMGNPITYAGISWGYYNAVNMISSLYPNREIKQKSDIWWLSGGETETLTRYLLTAGPTAGRKPIRRDELLIRTDANPGSVTGYVPICDMRTPGDYDHPMNFALDTTNLGSEYLYIYIKNSAGGRTKGAASDQNVYKKKHYVAAVVCGTGKTPEEAIANLYANAKTVYPSVASEFPDVSDTPLVTEFDEIIPVDLSDPSPWYSLYRHDTAYVDPADDEWVYGNEAANLRWGHDSTYEVARSSGHVYVSTKTADDVEKTRDCAYIGVIRTDCSEEVVKKTVTKKDGTEVLKDVTVYPAYAILKYYLESGDGPSELHVGNVTCQLAGGPVNSREGRYFLYYSTNSATASFSAPITEIDVSNDAFINGFNTTYSCSEKDRVDYSLPEYSQLRMRTDEFKYIHTKFDMDDLPYIEHIYIGVGKNKTEAFADLIGTTNANAATSVNVNHGSFSDEWIAIGYRRTKNVGDAVKDVMLYSGSNPPDEFTVDAYDISSGKVRGNAVLKYKASEITYTLIRHNLKVGAEVVSLNKGNGGRDLYLYYTRGNTRCAYSQDAKSEIFPIRNIVFSYGDLSPAKASTQDLSGIFSYTFYGMKTFDTEAYSDPAWERVLGVEGDTPAVYKLDGTVGEPMNLNYGVLPRQGNTSYHSGDRRVMMYVDRGSYTQLAASVKFTPRAKAMLGDEGYFSTSTTYGVVIQ